MIFDFVILSELISGCSLLLVSHEDDQESLKQDYSVKVDTKRLVHRIPVSLSFGIMNNLLNIIEGKGAEKEETTV